MKHANKLRMRARLQREMFWMYFVRDLIADLRFTRCNPIQQQLGTVTIMIPATDSVTLAVKSVITYYLYDVGEQVNCCMYIDFMNAYVYAQ